MDVRQAEELLRTIREALGSVGMAERLLTTLAPKAEAWARASVGLPKKSDVPRGAMPVELTLEHLQIVEQELRNDLLRERIKEQRLVNEFLPYQDRHGPRPPLR